MAILKGIEVSVVTDGKVLTEYDDEDTADENTDHPSKISKYIEAVSDAEFGIAITVPSSYDFAADCLAFRIRLDGVWVRTSFCRKAKRKRRKDWQKTMAGINVENGEGWYLRPFKFNDINIGKTNLHILIICVDQVIQLKRQLQQLAAARATVSQGWGPSTLMSMTKKSLARVPTPKATPLDLVNHPNLQKRSSKVETLRFRLGTRTLVVDRLRTVANTSKIW